MPKSGTYHNLQKLVLRVLVVAISSAYYGFMLANFSAIPQQTISDTWGSEAVGSSMYGVLAGAFAFGAIPGALIAPFLMKCFSRRQFILVVNCVAFTIGGVIQIPNLWVLLGMRFASGICVGSFMAITPVYINELTPKEIVGTIGVFTRLFTVVGIVIPYAMSNILVACHVPGNIIWRVSLAFPNVPIAFQSVMLAVGFVPESPNSLLARGRTEEAREVIGMFTKGAWIGLALEDKQLEINLSNRIAKVTRKSSRYSGIDPDKATSATPYQAILLGANLPLTIQMSGEMAVVTEAQRIVDQINPGLGIGG